MRHTLASVATALGWVVVSLVSLAAGLVALLTTLALARQAHAGAVQMWVVAVLVTFGVPFALAAWKHHATPRKIRAAMAWLPALWNTAALLVATLLIPDLTATALRDVDFVVTGELGDSHPMTRAMSAFGHEAADRLSPPAPPRTPLVPPPAGVALDRAIEVPFNEQGTAIMLGVELHGPEDSVHADYLFDTGASYTTITSDVAARLGVPVPEDAPTLQFNTASGPRESRMVFLPALTLGDVHIEGLLVSVCDPCANDRTRGLLGLNVMREFFVQMDYQGRAMQLLPRIQDSEPNRAYDIEPTVSLAIEGRPEIWLGRVRWVVSIHNRGTEAIERVVPRVEFQDGPVLEGEPVARIEPGHTGRSLVVGKVTEHGEDAPAVEFTLTLAEAHW